MLLQIPSYPENIVHQRASPWSNLYNLHLLPSPLRQPFRVQPYTNKLTKHLTNLRRRYEIAFCTELILSARCLSRVVAAFGMSETLSHVRRYRYWTCRLRLTSMLRRDTQKDIHTVIASASVFASGVDHCRSEVAEVAEDHLHACFVFRHPIDRNSDRLH